MCNAMKTSVRMFVCLCALFGVVAAEETLQSFHVKRGGDDYHIQLRRQTEGEFNGAYYFVVTLPHHVRLGRWSDSDLSLSVFYENGESQNIASTGIVIVSMAGGKSAHTTFMLRSVPKKAVFRMKKLNFGLIMNQIP